MSRMRNIVYGRMLSDGSVKVWATVGAGYREVVGRMMPPRFDSRQQPKSLAMRLVEQRTRPSKTRLILSETRAGVFVPPLEQHPQKNVYVRTGRGGSFVFDGDTGKNIGTILPTVSDEVLRSSPGLQSWSKDGATNSPTRKGS